MQGADHLPCRLPKNAQSWAPQNLFIPLQNGNALPDEKRRSTTDALFRALSENAPVGITLARAGRTLYANRAYLQLFGYSDPSAVLGQTLLNQIAPECRQQIADHVRRRELGEVVPTSYETIGLRQDGSTFPFRVDVARIQLDDGPANLAFFTDVAEHRNTERELSQALARERAARSRSRNGQPDERRVSRDAVARAQDSTDRHVGLGKVVAQRRTRP